MADAARTELVTELAGLLSKEEELSVKRRKLHERIDRGFPNEILLEEERRVSQERRELHGKIDRLRARIELDE
jgi:hypothetical protein